MGGGGGTIPISNSTSSAYSIFPQPPPATVAAIRFHHQIDVVRVSRRQGGFSFKNLYDSDIKVAGNVRIEFYHQASGKAIGSWLCVLLCVLHCVLRCVLLCAKPPDAF